MATTTRNMRNPIRNEFKSKRQYIPVTNHLLKKAGINGTSITNRERPGADSKKKQ